MPGQRVYRQPAQSGRTDSLVILLHGYGANGQDLISLGEFWAAALPNTAFIAPDAPEDIPYAGAQGFQWFDLTMRDPNELSRGVDHAGPGLARVIGRELEGAGVPPSRLALVGFSQGTMMALHVGLRMGDPPAAIVGLSGVIAAGERLPAECSSRPPVMLVHGTDDQVIPVDAIHLTREALAAAEVPVEWHILPGLPHGIDERALGLAGSFLRQHLRRPGG
jgi:phospholipase/carboxylesterase